MSFGDETMSKRFKYFFLGFIVFIAVYFFLQHFIINSSISPKKKNIISLTNNHICNVVESNCYFYNKDKRVDLTLIGKVRTMQPFNISVKLKNFSNDIEAVTVNFLMKSMNMGMNIFVLEPNQKTILNTTQWQSKILLPVCVSKRSDWDMILKNETKNSIYELKTPLQIE